VPCSARSASSRVLVDTALEGLFEDEQLRLIRLGLVGRVHVDATLRQHRVLWFDDDLDAQSFDLTLTWSADDRTYRIEGRPVEDPRHLALERLVFHRGPDADGVLTVEVRARLQVVTTSSLRTVAGWMMDGERSSSATRLLGVLAQDLTLSAQGRCEVAK
jgi:hypothetical protein